MCFDVLKRCARSRAGLCAPKHSMRRDGDLLAATHDESRDANFPRRSCTRVAQMQTQVRPPCMPTTLLAFVHIFIFPVPEQASVSPAHTQLHPSTPQEPMPPRFHFKPPSKPCMQYAPRPLSHHSDSQHIEPLVRKPEWPFPTPNVTARQASVLT